MKFVALLALIYGYREYCLGQVANHWLLRQDCLLFGSIFKNAPVVANLLFGLIHPIVADIIFDKISLDYTLTLMAASGHQAEAAKKSTWKIQRRNILCKGSILEMMVIIV